MKIFEELKRRNVFRVGFAYLLSAWLLLQLTEVLMEILELPPEVGKTILLLLLVGLIPALILAWAFELTPDGIKMEKDVVRDESVTAATGRKMDRAVIVLLLIALAYFVWESRFSAKDDSHDAPVEAVIVAEPEVIGSAEPEPVGKSLAVLPFLNMSSDAEQEYFSDGISDELINILVQIDGLRVPSRTSSFTFKDSEKNAAEIGKELNVSYLLEGSVRKDGTRIRVIAQLIEVATDSHLWSKTYTRELNDLFAVQDELARSIVDALKITMSGSGMEQLANQGTDNFEAYNLFLKGRHLWNQRTLENLSNSTAPLAESVRLDPGFDRAWAALADSHVLIPEYSLGSNDTRAAIDEHIPLAREAAQAALKINPDSARALTTLAYIQYMYDLDWEGAESNFRRAIGIDPDYATAHQWYGEMLGLQRRFTEAIEQTTMAVRIDPLSPVAKLALALNLMAATRFDEAFLQLQTAHAMAPQMQNVVRNLLRLHLYRGEYAEAREMSEYLAGMIGQNSDPFIPIIDALEDPGKKPAALESLRTTQFPMENVYIRPVYAAMLDDEELALDLMELIFDIPDPQRSGINKLYAFRNMREHPRFIALLARVNLNP